MRVTKIKKSGSKGKKILDRIKKSKMAKSGSMAKGGYFYLTDDTYVNIFTSRGFKEKRGSMGLKFFEHKPTGIFITYDPRGIQTRVIIESSSNPEDSNTIYEGDTMRDVKQVLDKAGAIEVMEGKDKDSMASSDDIMDEFNKLAKVNNHTEAAILLANHFGTDEEINILNKIQIDQDKRGYITPTEQSERDAISNKYYYKLKNKKSFGGSMAELEEIKDEDLDEAIKKMEKELGGGQEAFQEGGETETPYPVEDATTLEVGYQSKGVDGNMWEIQKDYKDVNQWVLSQVEEVIEKPKVEGVKLTPLQEGLLKKGFINDDLTLTNKGKRIVDLHKFCFPLDVHPFSHIYYGLDRLYPDNESIYLAIDRSTMFTGKDQEYFEIGDNLPAVISDKSVYDADLEESIKKTQSEKIKYIPYSYCPGVDDDKTGIGFVVFGNMLNTTELYVDAGIYNYALKVHSINGWKADSEDTVFIYGYEGRKLKVAIRVKEQVIGLYERIGMYNIDKVVERLRANYAKLFIKGEDIIKFEDEKKRKEEEEIWKQKLQLIKNWKELIDLTDDEDEREIYRKEIEKLK